MVKEGADVQAAHICRALIPSGKALPPFPSLPHNGALSKDVLYSVLQHPSVKSEKDLLFFS